MSDQTVKRYRIYSNDKPGRTYLCIIAARDKRRALACARRIWTLPRTAYASEELPMPRNMP